MSESDNPGLIQAVISIPIIRRLRAHAWLKALGSTLAIGSFFMVYFYVMHHPVRSVRIMPLTWPDNWIPIWPPSVWAYFSLWVYICLPTSLIKTRQALAHYLLGAVGLSFLGLSLFAIYPTAVPEWNIDWSQYQTLAFLKESDASGNACPSLHVGFAVYAGCWLGLMVKALQAPTPWHWGNGLWCLAIILSTMGTKQHVFLDVVAGAMLGACVFLVSRWWLLRLKVQL